MIRATSGATPNPHWGLESFGVSLLTTKTTDDLYASALFGYDAVGKSQAHQNVPQVRNKQSHKGDCETPPSDAPSVNRGLLND